jgi:hypothetical protein
MFDLCYGSLYVGAFHDWFDTEDPDRRTVVKDLGLRSWSDQFAIPVLRPLPDLKPGEHHKTVFGLYPGQRWIVRRMDASH